MLLLGAYGFPSKRGIQRHLLVEDVEPVQWGPETEKAFQAIKGALAFDLALGLADYSKAF